MSVSFIMSLIMTLLVFQCAVGGGDGGSNISRGGLTRILALIHGSSDGTLRRAQDLRRALHAPHSRGLRLGIQASLALLRRMEASRVGCDGQLIDLRFVPCEVRPENLFHFYDE